jgi:hypothetical protein
MGLDNAKVESHICLSDAITSSCHEHRLERVATIERQRDDASPLTSAAVAKLLDRLRTAKRLELGSAFTFWQATFALLHFRHLTIHARVKHLQTAADARSDQATRRLSMRLRGWLELSTCILSSTSSSTFGHMLRPFDVVECETYADTHYFPSQSHCNERTAIRRLV